MKVERWHEIDAPAELVWSVISDVARWPLWMPTVRQVTPVTPLPMEIGSRYRLKQPLQPPATWQITQFDPPHVFEWERREQERLVFVGRHAVEAYRGHARLYVSLEAFGTLNQLLRPVFGAVIATECRATERRCLEIKPTQ